ncbi:PglZ domain protein [Desulfamplus magnetovallimortis]|uniref:PglZ domain protein n=1 Tax=Desulfamplus magnetovallimortis TaxID=1246637 RepID=A0A1W1HBQ1_9BACT|nr:BREX-1 system phosphatase PglZ type A [Desulfamplus magnetovallimortis]SLM29866.1 PglZ domain protein [Desulfamplus magnetovallimortis]
MDIEQTNQALTRIFQEEKKRLVFWYDAEKEFEELLPSIEVEGATLIRIDEVAALDLKIRLETQDLEEKFILYAPYPEPSPETDWLCDIKLYSSLFHADKASILMKELGLSNMSMRPYIKGRSSFFRSQDRLDRLKKWVEFDDRKETMDLKMLTVLTRASRPEPFAILMKLMDSFCKDDQFNPTLESKPWKEIESLELSQYFWSLMTQTFGYTNESDNGQMEHSLKGLLIKVFVTDFANNFKNDLPISLEHFKLPGTITGTNASVFINQWQTHTIHCQNFNRISRFIDDKLGLADILSGLEIEDLIDVMTFEKVEQRIISSLRDQIINISHKDFSDTLEIIKKRVDGYWCNHRLYGTSGYDAKGKNLYQSAYQALEIAIDLFYLRKKYDSGFHYKSAVELFAAYTEKLYRFDQDYRQFIEIANQTEQAGWDVLKPLRQSVDDCYSGWFMEQLSMSWGDFLESDASSDIHASSETKTSQSENRNASTALLETWKLPRIINQYNFFKQRIKPILTGSDRSRIFVIISDAFRYEAAKELTTSINGKYRLKAEIEPMLGVLPSYTSLGMASLLPHQSLSFPETTSHGKSDAATPRIDGKSTASLEQRAAILNEFDGTAIKASELSSMSKDKGREFVKQHRVIYIYHDQIDAVGDKAASEEKTFEAVRTTIDELTALVGFIINSLNGTRILITSDHGFIYQEKELEQLDKSTLTGSTLTDAGVDMGSPNVIKKHKRFILGKDLGFGKDPCLTDTLFSGNTRQTAGTDTDMKFWLPKGTNRFYFTGGAKFFHGGAMLQEIVIPMVTVSEMKGIHREESEIKRVGVSILGSTKKIVTNIPRFDLIQTDAVSERMKARILKISLRDGNNRISSEETITFDSSSSSMEDRKKAVKLPLQSRPFDNKKEYALVLRNAEDETEYDRVPIKIDIAFANDF